MANVYICSLVNNVDAYHNIAYEIKKDSRVDDIYLILGALGKGGAKYNPVGECNRLSNQSDGVYTEIYYQSNLVNKALNGVHSDRDEAKFVEKYGNDTLRSYITAARGVYYKKYSYEQMKSIVLGLLKLYYSVFDNSEPSLFIADDMGSVPSMIPFDIVRKDFGQSIRWHTTRVANQYAISKTRYDEFDSVSKLYKKFKQNELNVDEYSKSYDDALGYLKKFRNDEMSSTADLSSSNKAPSEFIKKIGKMIISAPDIIKYSRIYNEYGYEEDFKVESTQDLIKRKLKNKYRRYRLRNSYIFDNSIEHEKYVYYPLHFQPEWSTLVLAPMYSEPLNQISLIQQIARSLPLDYQLYVKPHPTQYDKYPHCLGIYKTISEINGVRLFNHTFNSHRLIQKSDLVTVITGTAGFEAALYQTPSITIGNPSYSIMESIPKCDKLDELSHCLSECIKNHDYSDEDLIQYLTAVFEEGFQYDKTAIKSGDSPKHDMYLNNVVEEIKSELHTI